MHHIGNHDLRTEMTTGIFHTYQSGFVFCELSILLITSLQLPLEFCKEDRVDAMTKRGSPRVNDIPAISDFRAANSSEWEELDSWLAASFSCNSTKRETSMLVNTLTAEMKHSMQAMVSRYIKVVFGNPIHSILYRSEYPAKCPGSTIRLGHMVWSWQSRGSYHMTQSDHQSWMFSRVIRSISWIGPAS